MEAEKITPEELTVVAKDLGVNLYDWQLDMIFDRTIKRWCLNLGRKCGKSTAIEARAAMRLLNDSVPGSGKTGGILILSKNDRDEKALLGGVKNILRAFGWEFCGHGVGMS